MHRPLSLSGVFRNRNVTFIIVFCFLDGACFSVWSAQLLPVFVSRLGGDKAVGWSAAACGIAQIAGAAVAGYAGDKLPRTETLRCAFYCGILAVVSTFVAVFLMNIHAIYISQALWGVYMGVSSTSTEALFGDSVLSGRRTCIYNFKWMVQTLCYCVGYTVALVMLLSMGNDWSINSIQLVMLIGLAAHPVAQSVLLLLRDEDALAYDENGVYFSVQEERRRRGRGVKSRQGETSPVLQEPLLFNERSTGRGSTERVLPNDSNSSGARQHAGPPPDTNRYGLSREEEEVNARDFLASNDGSEVDESYVNSTCFSCCHVWAFNALPYLVCFTELWMAVGSGMTVQYLTLFLVNDFGITPTWLMTSYITISCSTALCSTVLRYVGEHCMGRLPAVITVRLIGTTLLFMLATVVNSTTPLAIVLTFFIARNAAMNSTMGVTRSIIMDCVSKSSRAKWSAFESFSSLAWAGSAVIGGYIAAAKGYQYTFFITAIFHYIGTAILVPAAIAAHGMERRIRQLKREERANE